MGEYSDDDLDDLPESALRQLEHNAIQSTQALRRVTAPKQPLRPYPNPPPFDTLGLDDDDDLDLDDSDVFNQSTAAAAPGARAQPPAAHRADRTFPDESQAPLPQRWNPRAPNAPANVPRPPNAPVPAPRRFQESQSFRPPALHNRPQPSQFPRGFAPPPPRYAPSQSQAPVHPNAIAALEQRLRSLETELNVSKGEASILRANSTKAQQANEAELARLRRRNEELAAENERVLQKAVQAERTAATELEFAQREMQEVASRARRNRESNTVSSSNTTPRKASRTWGVADGFDGMDLVPSPTKTMSRTKSAPMPGMPERTPTRGKRKRFVESPVPPLETTEEVVVVAGEPSTGDRATKLVTPVPAAAHSLPFDFLPLILDHSPAHGQPPTFDSFAGYFYPSDPQTSFSSIIFQSLPTKTDPNYPIRILSDFSFLIINLWARCLQEEFFVPMRELVSLLTFTLQLHSISIVPELIEKLLPVAQTTLHVISDIRAAAANENAGATGDLQALQASLDSASVVALLHLCALVCTTSTEKLEDGDTPREAFWKGFAMETVSLVLGSKQPLADIVGMLEMLSTSVLPLSIGPVVGPDKESPHAAVFLLDKLSKFLMYPPAAARSPAQRHAVAASALRTLISFSASESAARQMATHDNLVLRLIATLSRSVDELYDQELSERTFRPRRTTTSKSQTTDGDDAAMTLDEALAASSDRDSDVHGLCTVISHATLLLHGLVTDPRTADLVGLERKFEGWRGGGRKYLVMLCRLNFAEDDGVLEAGIDVETAERAHELLEMLVSVEGGRDVGEAFGSPE